MTGECQQKKEEWPELWSQKKRYDHYTTTGYILPPLLLSPPLPCPLSPLLRHPSLSSPVPLLPSPPPSFPLLPPLQMESSSAPNIIKDTDLHPDPTNSSPSLTILANSNSNNNTRNAVSAELNPSVLQREGGRGDSTRVMEDRYKHDQLESSQTNKSLSHKKVPTTLV